jgi:hypothetical protein
MNGHDLIPVPLAAKRTSKLETAIRRGVASGAIQGVKMGWDWLIPAAEVDRLAREYPLADSEVVCGR